MTYKSVGTIIILLFFYAVTSFAQDKTQTTIYKGKRITWAVKPILLQSDKPQVDGKTNERYVYERLGMLKFEGKDVKPSKEKSIIKEVQKQLQKANKTLKQPMA